MQSTLETNQKQKRQLAWTAGLVFLALLASLAARLVAPDAYLQPLLWVSIGIVVVLVLLVFVAILLLVQGLILGEQNEQNEQNE